MFDRKGLGCSFVAGSVAGDGSIIERMRKRKWKCEDGTEPRGRGKEGTYLSWEGVAPIERDP